MFNIYKPSIKLKINSDELFSSMNPEKIKEWTSSCFMTENERQKKPFPMQAQAEMIGTTEDKIINVLDKSMIDCINSFLSNWKGTPQGIGAGWVDPFIEKWKGTDIQKNMQLKIILHTIASPYMIVDEDKNALSEKPVHRYLPKKQENIQINDSKIQTIFPFTKTVFLSI